MPGFTIVYPETNHYQTLQYRSDILTFMSVLTSDVSAFADVCNSSMFKLHLVEQHGRVFKFNLNNTNHTESKFIPQSFVTLSAKEDFGIRLKDLEQQLMDSDHF